MTCPGWLGSHLFLNYTNVILIFRDIFCADMDAGAMAASHPAESEVVFQNRLEQLGLIDLKDNFAKKGWKSYADFAMACSDLTGKDAAKFREDVIVPILGDPPEEHRIPKLRRLFIQSYAAHSQLLEAMDAPPTDKPHKMHPLDREAGLTDVKTKVSGFTVEGDTEPSYFTKQIV